MLKTLKRKIALVAVAGLGFGLVSTVPAFSAPGDISKVYCKGTAAQTGAISCSKLTADVATAGKTLAITARAGQEVNLTVDFVNPAANGSITITDAGTNVLKAAVATATGETTKDPIIVVPTTLGVRTLTVTGLVGGVATTELGTITLTVVGAPRSITAVTGKRVLSPTKVADNTEKYTLTVKDVNGSLTHLASNEQIALAVTSTSGLAAGSTSTTIITDTTNTNTPGTTDIVAAAQLTADKASSGVEVIVEEQSVGETNGLSALLLDGTTAISGINWSHATSSSTAALANAGVVLSVVDGTDATVAVTSRTAAAGGTASTVKVKAVDSDGRIVKNLTIAQTASSAAVSVNNATASTGNDGLGAAMTITGNTAGAHSVSFSFSTGSTTVSYSLPVTVIGSVNVDGYDLDLEASATTKGWVEVSDFADVDVDTGTTDGTDRAYATYKADPTKTDTFTVEVAMEDASDLPLKDAVVTATTSSTGSAIPTGQLTPATTATTNLTLNAAGKATLTVKNTTPNPGEVVLVTITSGAVTIGKVQLTWESSAVAADASTLTLTPSAASVTVKTGSKITTVVNVADQYSEPVANTDVTIQHTGPNAPLANAVLTTNASGDVTYEYTDSKAIAGGANDVITVKTVGAVTITGAASVSYVFSASEPGAATISVTYDVDGQNGFTGTALPTTLPLYKTAATATGFLIDTQNALTEQIGAGANEEETIAYEATVRNSAGTAVAGAKVTVAGAKGVWVRNALGKKSATRDLYTDTAGKVQFLAGSDATGTVEFTVTSGAASTKWTVAYTNAQSDARTVEIAADSASVTSGKAAVLTATVKDRYGNPVKGATITFSKTGIGRFAGGALIITGATTDAAGVALQEASNLATESGEGTFTATITSVNQSGNAAGFVSYDANGDGDWGDGGEYYVQDATAEAGVATKSVKVTFAAAAANTEITAVKADVKAVSDTVATLSKAVTTIQSSVTELTSSFSAQIKSLSSAIAKISRAIAALSKRIR